MAESLNPPVLVIDNYEELIINALVHANVVSNGEITDINPSGFLRPFVGTMSYVGSELLYKVNLCAIAAAKSFLSSVVGINEDLGNKATTTLQFGLATTLTSNFLIPAGYQVSDSSGLIRFYTQAALVIPAGSNFGTVDAIAEEIGEGYNIDPGVIQIFTVPLTYLDYVVNVTPGRGGRLGETDINLVERAAQKIRIRNPVSALDFEQLAEEILGVGSKAKCIGLLGINRDVSVIEKGVVHLFLLSSLGEPVSASTASFVGNTLSPRLNLGTRLLVSPMSQLDITISLICELKASDKTVDNLTDEVYDALSDYFKPVNFPVGGSILLEEVKYQVRSVGGLIISYLDINGEALNTPMPNDWTQANFVSLTIQIVDLNGVVFNDTRFRVLNGDE
jgi:hypothetical protein